MPTTWGGAATVPPPPDTEKCSFSLKKLEENSGKIYGTLLIEVTKYN